MEAKWFCPVTTSETNNNGCLQQPENWEYHDNYRPYVICNNIRTCSSNSISGELNSSDDLMASQSCKSFTNSKTTPSSGVNLRVTGQCSQGGRKYMEDFFTVAYQQSENSKDLEYAFIGIYDGHGGAEAATFAKEHLMLEIINQKLFWSDLDQDVLRAIREGYIATHYAMWRQQDKWPKTGNGLLSTAGTTATVAFIRREKLFIGHVGDSGIVLGYQNDNEDFWRAKQLTVDHKPEVPKERTRILKSGGKVIIKSGVPRVVWNRPRNVNHRGPILRKTPVDEIPFLAVARSLGDLWSYNSERDEFVVSPDPDVKVIPIDPRTFRCLIFGTDGLWNVVTPQEAVNTVRDNEFLNESLLSERGNNENNSKNLYWINPSKMLIEQALQNWSAKKMRADNTSVVTVILYPPGKIERFTSNNNSNKCHTSMSFEPTSSEFECNDSNSEVTMYNDASDVTYKELAMKHLPPEEYRNYDYFGHDVIADKNFDMASDCVLDHDYNLDHNRWSCDMGTSENIGNKIINSTSEAKDYYEPYRKVCALDYNKYMQHVNIEDKYVNNFINSYNALSRGEQIQTNTRDLSWITSNNSNLDSLADKAESKNSSYMVNVQAMDQINMQDIIKEQQLYQQQCMNEGDGYSLTKLETRREQQTIKVQNINESSNLRIVEEQPVCNSEIVDIQLCQLSRTSTLMQQISTERLYYQHDMAASPVTQRLNLLEYQVLVQQDRGEEKQVAFENQQMLNDITSSSLVNEQRSLSNFYDLVALSNETPNQTFGESMKENGQIMEQNDNDEKMIEQVELDKLVEENLNERPDLCDVTVQSQEVSSTSSHEENELEEETNELINHKGNKTTKNDPYNTFCSLKCDRVSPKMSLRARNARPTTFINIRRTNNRMLCRSATGSTNPVNSKAITSVNNYIKSRTRSRCHFYSNIQDGNLQRGSRHSFNHNSISNQATKPRKCSEPIIASCSKINRGRHFKREVANKNSNNIQSTLNTKRKLRSSSKNCINSNNSSHTGFFKSTLRPRNSITKDMKTKNNLITTALIFPRNVTSRHYLDNVETRFKVMGDPLLNNESKCITSCKIVKNHLNDKKKASAKTSHEVPLNNTLTNDINLEQHPIYTINLRSRTRPSSYFHNVTNNNSTRHLDPVISVETQLKASFSSPKTPSANLTPKMFINERPIQHSMHTRSSSKLQSVRTLTSPKPLMVGGFSKSMRPQNGGSNLAQPPPSPKLINAIAAVAAATRARSLLSSKQGTTVTNTQSVLTTVFGKRSSLRSNSNISRTSLTAATASSSRVLSSISRTPCNNKLLKQPSQTIEGRIIKRLKR